MRIKPFLYSTLVGVSLVFSTATCAEDAGHLYEKGMAHYYDLHWDEAMQSFQGSAQIYFQSGLYHNASSSNVMAIAALTKYLDTCREKGVVPKLTYGHRQNYDLLRASAAMEGRKEISISAARDLVENLSAAHLKQDPTLQWFIPVPYFVNARFGLWDKMLQEPKPNANYQYALGMWHYGRGLAYVHKGNLRQGTSELAQLNEIIQKGPSTTEVNFGAMGVALLNIANHVLSASIAEKRGDEQATIANLKEAMVAQDNLGSEQATSWYFPVKEALGDAYLKWGHPDEAIKMFEEDLKQYPNNGWALYGMSRSFSKLGDQKKAAQFEKEFKNAWQESDIGKPVILF
jgi:tetratricopeptide (TPR) repeat protein